MDKYANSIIVFMVIISLVPAILGPILLIGGLEAAARLAEWLRRRSRKREEREGRSIRWENGP